MDFILEVYRVERAALDADLLGTPEHLAMRQSRSRVYLADVLLRVQTHPASRIDELQEDADGLGSRGNVRKQLRCSATDLCARAAGW
jgi:hypothetical protein